MKKSISIIIIALLLINPKLFASFDFNDNCKKAYIAVSCLDFNLAKEILIDEKKIHPENFIPYYIENSIDFLKVAIGEKEEDFLKFKKNKKDRIERLIKNDKSSPYYRYCMADIYLQSAFVRVKFKDYMYAALEINKAYRILEENNRLHKDFLPNYKNLGLIHALIGTIPDDYKWVNDLLSVRGSVKLGISELTNLLLATSKNKEYEYLQTETLIILTFIEVNLENDKENVLRLFEIYQKPIVQELVKNSPLLCYSYASIATHLGMNDKAIEILINRKSIENTYQYHYLNLMLGEAKLFRLDNDADVYLMKYINEFQGKNYVKVAYQKLAWYYLINNQTEKYKSTIADVLKHGDAFFDSDKQAETEAKSNNIPNPVLLKVRLLFDGGYYYTALNALVENKPSSFINGKKDALEYTYRFGRIYHQVENYEKSISYYALTLEEGREYNYYFAANSALQLGLIYENANDYEKAEKYFRQCLKLKPEEYKNGIHQKAKAGLNRIGK